MDLALNKLQWLICHKTHPIKCSLQSCFHCDVGSSHTEITGSH